MAPRPLGPFMESPGSYGNRPKSRWLWLPVLLLLLVVLAFVFRIIPQGPVEVISDSRARKMLVEAEALENKSINLNAAKLYTRIAENDRVSATLRVKAAKGMARVYREVPGHDEDVETALELAYILTPTGEEQDALKDELEGKRGRPLAAIQTRTPDRIAAASDGSSSSLVTLPPLPRDADILARIGGEAVSIQEILFAWHLSYGPREPNPEELKRFTSNYLDLVLLADEACRRSVDRLPETVYDLRMRRILALNQALTSQLINTLQTPDAKTLEEYYNTHKPLFTTPERVLVGHIVVQKPDDEAKVAKALAQGQKFDKVASQYSLDAKNLQNGYLLGWISRVDPSIPGLGVDPSLVAGLLALDDGDTTGPIRTQRGLHWIHVVSRTPAKLRPYKDAQGDVLLNYQKVRLAENQQKLVQQLHATGRIEIVDPTLGQDLTGPEGDTPAPAAHAADGSTTAAQTADAPTTATLAANAPTTSATLAAADTITTTTTAQATPSRSGKKSRSSKSRAKTKQE